MRASYDLDNHLAEPGADALQDENNDLIGRIYETALSPGDWMDLLDTITGWTEDSPSGDGNDVEEVVALAEEARSAIRAGGGPFFLELSTYRWREHCGPYFDNDLGYRTPEEFDAWRATDPIDALAHDVGCNELEAMRVEIEEEIRQAIEFARTSPFPEAAETVFPVVAGGTAFDGNTT